MKKDINSREDGVTKDMQPESRSLEHSYRFPALGGIVVTAKDYQTALKKAKAEFKKKFKQ